jgi:hypothetical protein
MKLLRSFAARATMLISRRSAFSTKNQKFKSGYFQQGVATTHLATGRSRAEPAAKNVFQVHGVDPQVRAQ